MAESSRRSSRQNFLEDIESTISRKNKEKKSSFCFIRKSISREEEKRFTGRDHDCLLDDEIFIGAGRKRVNAATSCFGRIPTRGEEKRDAYLMDTEGRRSSSSESEEEVSPLEPTREGRARPRKTRRAGFRLLQGEVHPLPRHDVRYGEEENQYDKDLLNTSTSRTDARSSGRLGSGKQQGPLEVPRNSNPASRNVTRRHRDIENSRICTVKARQENIPKSRSFKKSPVNDFGDETPFNLAALLRRQEEVLHRRRRISIRDTRRQRRRLRPLEDADDGHIGDILRTISERWERTLELLPHDFFSSSEAPMEEMSKVQKGTPAYQALPIDVNNCEDMLHIYRLKYEPKKSMGQPVTAYDQFRTAVGQYLRLCVASNIVNVNLLYEKGKIFYCVTHLNTVRAFIMYFRIRGSASTVAGKSLHLKLLAHHAQIFYNGKDKELVGKSMAVEEYLLSQASAQKKEARRCAQVRRSTEERLSRGVMFFPEDFSKCVKVARKHLDGIITSFRYALQEAGVDRAIREFSRKGGLIEKWSINFLAALLLCGGGQRPQVYCQLQVPLRDELQMMQRRADQEGFIEPKTVLEKTPRALDMPNVIFPTYMIAYIKFQTKYIRPIIFQRTTLGDRNSRGKPLLLNTRNGDPISSSQVCSTLRRFLSKIDPELSKVTLMTLRGSYATMMVQSYRKGKVFQDKSEQEFLEFLGQAMNTSVEQLAATYVGCDQSDFRNCASEMTSVLAGLGEQGAVDSKGEGEERDLAAEYLWSYE